MRSPLFARTLLSNGEKLNMRVFNLKVAIIIICAVVASITIVHSIVYLSIEPSTLSAELPSVKIKWNDANTGAVLVRHRN
jgi:hypothetical protein